MRGKKIVFGVWGLRVVWGLKTSKLQEQLFPKSAMFHTFGATMHGPWISWCSYLKIQWRWFTCNFGTGPQGPPDPPVSCVFLCSLIRKQTCPLLRWRGAQFGRLRRTSRSRSSTSTRQWRSRNPTRRLKSTSTSCPSKQTYVQCKAASIQDREWHSCTPVLYNQMHDNCHAQTYVSCVDRPQDVRLTRRPSG